MKCESCSESIPPDAETIICKDCKATMGAIFKELEDDRGLVKEHCEVTADGLQDIAIVLAAIQPQDGVVDRVKTTIGHLIAMNALLYKITSAPVMEGKKEDKNQMELFTKGE